jgi:Domain of unknown function DUF11
MLMEEYNPNAVWTSKKKKLAYTPPEPTHVQETGNSGDNTAPPLRPSSKKSIITTIVAIVILAALGVVWFLNTRPVPAPAVGLDFAMPSQVASGDPFEFSVLSTNSSTVALRGASLAVTLPDGVFFVGQPESQRTETISVGDLSAGDSSSAELQLLTTANAGNVMQVSSTLSYATDASHGKLFSTSNQGSFAVLAPVIGLTISAPSHIFAGQNFTAEISYENTADHAVNGAQVTMQYPDGFTLVMASPTPAFPGNTVWNLGVLAPGAEGTITIAGTMNGKNMTLYSFAGTATENVSGTSYAVTAGAANVAITPSPLIVGAIANDNTNYIVAPGDELNYKITYTNLSSTTLQDVAITATLEGAMFDLSSVQSSAAFNSDVGTLTWYPANTPALISIAPGATGSVNLRIKTKTSFPIATVSDKNFTVGLHLAATSPTVPAGTAATGTSVSADVMNKVSGAIAIDTAGYRYEPGPAIVNSGPYPPKVNQPTTYTIHWRLTNYSTDVSNVTVSAYLQSGTMCTGKTTSTVMPGPFCNAVTGEISWSIPFIPAGTGILGAPLEAVFQVQNMPAVNQVGQILTLLGKTSVTATDAFTGATLSASAGPVTTSIPEDKAVPTNSGNVTQ